MLYPALRGCIVHDMQYGEIEDIETPGDPLSSVSAELAEKGGPETYTCRAIIFMPKDGKCGEVFVLIPEELRAEVAELMRLKEMTELAKTVVKQLLDKQVGQN